MFLDASWLAVYFGQNVIPQHYDPACDRLTLEALTRHLAGLDKTLSAAARNMPQHDAFLRQIGALGRGMHSP
jgi:tryptophan halogenase